MTTFRHQNKKNCRLLARLEMVSLRSNDELLHNDEGQYKAVKSGWKIKLSFTGSFSLRNRRRNVIYTASSRAAAYIYIII